MANENASNGEIQYSTPRCGSLSCKTDLKKGAGAASLSPCCKILRNQSGPRKVGGKSEAGGLQKSPPSGTSEALDVKVYNYRVGRRWRGQRGIWARWWW